MLQSKNMLKNSPKKKEDRVLSEDEDLKNWEKGHNLSVKHQISEIFIFYLWIFIPIFSLYLGYFMIFILDKPQQVIFMTKFFEFMSTPLIGFFVVVGKNYYDQNKK